MRRCTVVIPDAGPFNSLWVADRLDLLLRLDMTIVVIDAVYDEVTGDPSYPKDRDVKAFIDDHRPPFVVEPTDVGTHERARRKRGERPKRNAGELAIADFMSSEGGLRRYLAPGDPVALLFEDRNWFVFRKPPNLHLLTTVGLLRGLEKVGVIESADAIIHAMTHPSKPDRRPRDRRVLLDLPDGIDEAASAGSRWLPDET